MKPVFAWCFSHGCMHRFPDEPWCTASWVWVGGLIEDQALTAKQDAYGDARFIDELPARTQLAILQGEIPGQKTEASQ